MAAESVEQKSERENRIDYVEVPARISQEIFSCPGGRRFHFIDPVGNEYALWSAAGAEQH